MIGLLIVTADSFYAAASTVGMVSVAAVVASSHPVVTMVLARALLAERLAGPQRVGIAASLAGVFALAAT